MNTPDGQLLRPPNVSLQGVPYCATLEVAVEAAQALGRARGAALFVVGDDGLVLAVSTVDPSGLDQASEVCRGVLQSGWAATAAVSSQSGMRNGQVAAIAVPLVHRGSLTGVLYLEGFSEPPDRVRAIVRRCAQTIATILWLGRVDVTREFSAACGALVD